MIEALVDPKTWLFALFSALDNVPNSLTNQRQLIISSFGFNFLQTTLLGCVDGVIDIVAIATGTWLAVHFPNSRAYIGAAYFVPNIIGVFLVNLLPWQNKIGLLFSLWTVGQFLYSTVSHLTEGLVCHSQTWEQLVSSWRFPGCLMSLQAIQSVSPSMLSCYLPIVSGIVLVLKCGRTDISLGESIPHCLDVDFFPTQIAFEFSNHVPWIAIGVCYTLCAALLLVIRSMLAVENKRRDMEPLDHTYDNVYVEHLNEEGENVNTKVPKVKAPYHVVPRYVVLMSLCLCAGIFGSNRHPKSRISICSVGEDAGFFLSIAYVGPVPLSRRRCCGDASPHQAGVALAGLSEQEVDKYVPFALQGIC